MTSATARHWTGTSGLSPHLHFGEIGPRQLYRMLRPLLVSASLAAGPGGAGAKRHPCALAGVGRESAASLQAARFQAGRGYPAPMVELAGSRARALLAYQHLKASDAARGAAKSVKAPSIR